MTATPLPRAAIYFGLAGIAPQMACAVLALDQGGLHWFAIAAGCIYAAVILSFLGGLWWMALLQAGACRPGLYAIAVIPSLAAWGSILPWSFGWPWPAPSLLFLGLVLLVSPMGDRAVGPRTGLPPGWFRLRWAMSTGLGVSTLVVAAAAVSW